MHKTLNQTTALVYVQQECVVEQVHESKPICNLPPKMPSWRYNHIIFTERRFNIPKNELHNPNKVPLPQKINLDFKFHINIEIYCHPDILHMGSLVYCTSTCRETEGKWA